MSTEPIMLGRYALKHRIGMGGMAEVWLAEQSLMGGACKSVAIKLLSESSLGQAEHRKMFLDEARLSMVLSHSTIVQVFDAGEAGAECYIAMEWIDGLNLAQLNAMLWEQGQRLPLHIAVYITGEVLRALNHAHTVTSGEAVGIVHRDVSPQNVMLSVNGEVKLMDFGVARFANEETAGVNVKGKIRYMPPEQVRGMSKDPTVDLFAVGALLFEMIEGRRFREEWDASLIFKAMEGAVPQLSNPGEVPPELLRVLNGLLEPDPAMRIGTARSANAMLNEWSGYKNASFELESYVTRAKQALPPPETQLTGSRSRRDLRERLEHSTSVPANTALPLHGVNPPTGSTLPHLGPHDVDDTNVGSMWTPKRTRLTRASALAMGLLSLGMGSMTVVYAFGLAQRADAPAASMTSAAPGEQELERDSEQEVAAEQEPELAQVRVPEPPARARGSADEDVIDDVIEDVVDDVIEDDGAAETSAPVETPEPPDPNAPPPGETPDPSEAPVPVEVPVPAPAGGQDGQNSEKPAAQAKREKVKVTFFSLAKSLKYSLVIKVDNRPPVSIRGKHTMELPAGKHTLKVEVDDAFVKLGRLKLPAGHSYEVEILSPSLAKTTVLD